MKNILVLTKPEQRVVIAIVLALLAGRIAKYEWAAHSQPLPAKPTAIMATAPPDPARDESEPVDKTQ